VGRETILLFEIKGQGGGELFVTLSDAPGGTVVAGRATQYDVRFEVDIDVLKRLDRGELNGLTAMGQAESDDAAAMTATMSADFCARPSAEMMFRRLCFYFWTREWSGRIAATRRCRTGCLGRNESWCRAAAAGVRPSARR